MRPFLVSAAVLAYAWGMEGARRSVADDATRPLVSFTTRTLAGEFFAEGAGVGDFNHDGTPDVVAGPFWLAGPTFVERHEFAAAKPFDPHGYSDAFFAWGHGRRTARRGGGQQEGHLRPRAAARHGAA